MKLSFNRLLAILIISLGAGSCSKEGTTAGTAAASLTGKAGSLSKFSIVGNYLYAVDRSSLVSYDITNPVNPVKTNTADLNYGVETLYAYNNRLFIGTTTGMFIYSLDNPSTPSLLGSATHVRSCDPVVANDSIAFVTLKGSTSCGPAQSGLYVHDIKDLLHPVLINQVYLQTPEGLGLQDSTLYVCCNNDGLKVFNVVHPENPVEIKTLTGQYFKDVIPYGNLLICYISNGIMLYDISNPVDPVEVRLIEN